LQIDSEVGEAGISEHTHSVRAKFGKSLFGTDRDITLCAVFILPENQIQIGGDRSETENMFAHFGDKVHQALTDSPRLIACGDSNAHIGVLNEIPDTHLDVLNAHPQLVERRITQCTQTNCAGRFLVDIASNMDCILTMGGSPGDTGQPTFVGYDKKSRSRPDHIMVSKTQVHHTEFQKAHWLDHCFQTVTFATDAHNYNVDMRLHHDT